MRHTCVHYEVPFSIDFPYPPKQRECGATPNAEAQHGWLCKGHLGENNHSSRKFYGQRPTSVNEIIDSIKATEAREIAAGVKHRIRFGAVQPIYLTYLTAGQQKGTA